MIFHDTFSMQLKEIYSKNWCYNVKSKVSRIMRPKNDSWVPKVLYGYKSFFEITLVLKYMTNFKNIVLCCFCGSGHKVSAAQETFITTHQKQRFTAWASAVPKHSYHRIYVWQAHMLTFYYKPVLFFSDTRESLQFFFLKYNSCSSRLKNWFLKLVARCFWKIKRN